jgi:hypothetical protein
MLSSHSLPSFPRRCISDPPLSIFFITTTNNNHVTTSQIELLKDSPGAIKDVEAGGDKRSPLHIAVEMQVRSEKHHPLHRDTHTQ